MNKEGNDMATKKLQVKSGQVGNQVGRRDSGICWCRMEMVENAFTLQWTGSG